MKGARVKSKEKRSRQELSAAEMTAAMAHLELRLAELAVHSRKIAKDCGLSRREIAARMGLASPSTIQRILSPAAFYNVTIETLSSFALACEHGLKFKFVPIRPGKLDAALTCSSGSIGYSNVVDLNDWKRTLAARHAQLDLPSKKMTTCDSAVDVDAMPPLVGDTGG